MRSEEHSLMVPSTLSSAHWFCGLFGFLYRADCGLCAEWRVAVVGAVRSGWLLRPARWAAAGILGQTEPLCLALREPRTGCTRSNYGHKATTTVPARLWGRTSI